MSEYVELAVSVEDLVKMNHWIYIWHRDISGLCSFDEILLSERRNGILLAVFVIENVKGATEHREDCFMKSARHIGDCINLYRLGKSHDSHKERSSARDILFPN